MSQEQPPIRSRRELRQARDAARQAAAPAGKDQLSPATNPSRAAQAEAGRQQQKPVVPETPAAGKPAAEQTHTQRSSQIRARDRAALRTIKELEEKEGQLSAGGPPTRRQLRLQQLKEQALTSATPIVPPAAAPPAAPAKTPSQPGTADGTAAKPAAGAAKTSAGTPKSSPAKTGEALAGPAAAAKQPAAAPSPGAAPAGPAGMTVEQALAARSLIAEQAKNQIAKMEHIASMDPEAVDPDILAEQIALAERAAVLNRRAMARQKLAEQAGGPVSARDGQPADAQQKPAQPKAAEAKPGQPKPSQPKPSQPTPSQAGTGQPRPGQPQPAQPKSRQPATAGPEASATGSRPGPSTANNLAMVTPLEFVQVPGVDRPVMKPPATSHVPVTTRPGTKVPAGGGSKRRPANKSGRTAEPASGRSQVIARAEAAARAATRPKPVVFPDSQATFEDVPRIPASSAYGLDPLDAATAGLARARRNRILQFCILAFGMVALVSGVVLIISGMNP